MEDPTGDAKQRKEAADSLRKQIADLLSGHAPEKPSSLRDFVEQKMAEDRRKAAEHDQPGDTENPEDA